MSTKTILVIAPAYFYKSKQVGYRNVAGNLALNPGGGQLGYPPCPPDPYAAEYQNGGTRDIGVSPFQPAYRFRGSAIGTFFIGPAAMYNRARDRRL